MGEAQNIALRVQLDDALSDLADLRERLAGSIAAEGAAHKIIAELREKLAEAEKGNAVRQKIIAELREKLEAAEAQVAKLMEAASGE